MRGSDCPTEQDLAAFNLGDLPEAALEAISRHLEGCPSCDAFLDRLEDRTDSTLAALRNPEAARDRGRGRARTPPGAAAPRLLRVSPGTTCPGSLPSSKRPANGSVLAG